MSTHEERYVHQWNQSAWASIAAPGGLIRMKRPSWSAETFVRTVGELGSASAVRSAPPRVAAPRGRALGGGVGGGGTEGGGGGGESGNGGATTSSSLMYAPAAAKNSGARKMRCSAGCFDSAFHVFAELAALPTGPVTTFCATTSMTLCPSLPCRFFVVGGNSIGSCARVTAPRTARAAAATDSGSSRPRRSTKPSRWSATAASARHSGAKPFIATTARRDLGTNPGTVRGWPGKCRLEESSSFPSLTTPGSSGAVGSFCTRRTRFGGARALALRAATRMRFGARGGRGGLSTTSARPERERTQSCTARDCKFTRTRVAGCSIFCDSLRSFCQRATRCGLVERVGSRKSDVVLRCCPAPMQRCAVSCVRSCAPIGLRGRREVLPSLLYSL